MSDASVNQPVNKTTQPMTKYCLRNDLQCVDWDVKLHYTILTC